jgi:hypothetical protein
LGKLQLVGVKAEYVTAMVVQHLLALVALAAVGFIPTAVALPALRELPAKETQVETQLILVLAAITEAAAVAVAEPLRQAVTARLLTPEMVEMVRHG